MGSGSGGEIDWGSPRLQAEFEPIDADWEEWSSDSRSDGEWEWRVGIGKQSREGRGAGRIARFTRMS